MPPNPYRRGLYAARAGTVEPRHAHELALSLRAMGAHGSLVESVLAADPLRLGHDIDWQGFGFENVPGWVSESDPLIGAIRLLDPPGVRSWRKSARAEQTPPCGDWLYWLIMAGRGWGKTWTGANTIVEWALEEVGDYAVVAPTFGDARKVLTEGKQSGILVAAGEDLAGYNRSDYIVTLSNGSRIVLGSADAPDRLRGWNFRGAWLDELASYADARTLWDEVLLPAVRIGVHPRIVITTTPRRGAEILTELLERERAGDDAIAVTRGKTSDNAANLSPVVLRELYRRYAGTTVGRQELDGELLVDRDGALVTSTLIDMTRLRDAESMPMLNRICVAVDPSTTSKKTSDMCGIVVCGRGPAPGRGGVRQAAAVEGQHGYVLEDATMRGTPEAWGRRVLEVADEWDADVICAETNNGGDLVETMIRMIAKAEGRRTPRYHGVTATVDKRTRAEPVAGLFEQARGHIVGAWPGVEDGWTGWVPSDKLSPNELDACTWGMVELFPELAAKAKGRGSMRVLVGNG